MLTDQRAYGEARDYFERALKMRQALYPKDRYPRGHPELTNSMVWLGFVLTEQRVYDEARDHFERTLKMRQSLYPKERYPQGHPELADSLSG